MRYILLALLAVLCFGLAAATWQTFTNTDHVYDVISTDNDLYYSSWGGVIHQSLQGGNLQAESETINSGNGLISNDVRCLAYIGFSGSLWLGTSDQGVMIKSPAGMQHLTTELGLPSSRVSRIIEHESTIMVATSGGLAVFHYLEGVNFPLMLHQYTFENTNGGLLSNNILDMALTNDGRLFVATPEGVCYVPLESIDIDSAWTSLNDAGLAIPGGNSLHVAVNGDYLAVSVDGTVFRHPLNLGSGVLETFNTGNGLSGDDVSALYLDNANNLWVAYGNWDETSLSYSLAHNMLYSFIPQGGTPASVARNTLGLGTAPITRFMRSHYFLICGTWGEGIYRFVNEAWENSRVNSIGFPKITQIATDQNYASWYASGNIGPHPVPKGTMGVTKYLNGTWETFNIANSPIHSDNILCLAVDSQNRKWFGTWDNSHSPAGWLTGITIYDETDQSWKQQTSGGIRNWEPENNNWGPYDANNTRLMTSTIGGIYPGNGSEMIVMCYDGGVNIVDATNHVVAAFLLPNSVDQGGLFAYFNGSQYFFGTNNDRGLSIWNSSTYPQTGGSHWIIPSPPELNNCIVYGVVSIDTPYEGKQHWIATSTGLFMWNETTWYRYDTMIKRFKYNTSTYTWQNDVLYYEKEERLFGSVRTNPTCIYLDPFNRIWIGSMDNGFSMYNPETERFTNYFKPNYPLLSNYITTLGYDPLLGNLLIGTPDGLNTLKIGRTVKPNTSLQNVKAYPNPFYPDRDGSVQIVNLPDDSLPAGNGTCHIYDASGALVVKLEENAYSRFSWNGRSTSGTDCAAGVYMFVVADKQGNIKKGKIALIR